MSDSDGDEPADREDREPEARVMDNQAQHQIPHQDDGAGRQPVIRRNRAYRRQVVPVSERDGVVEYRYMYVRADIRNREEAIRRFYQPVSPSPDDEVEHPIDPGENQQIRPPIIRPIPLRLYDDNGNNSFLYQNAFFERGLPLHPSLQRPPPLHGFPFNSPDFLFRPPFLINFPQIPQINNNIPQAQPAFEPPYYYPQPVNADSDNDAPQDPHH